MIIVPDSSALIALSICDCLWLLDKLFGEVKVPPAVFQEVVKRGKPQSGSLRSYCETKITPINWPLASIEGTKGLGHGELEANVLTILPIGVRN
jgi:uncharacterized protein